MSDNTRWTGRWDITPPLPWSAYRDVLPDPDDTSPDGTSMFLIEEVIETVQTDEGELKRRVAVAIVPRRPGETWGKLRFLEPELEPIVAAVHHAGSNVSGYLYTQGDLAPTRHQVIERTWSPQQPWEIRSETALVVWPDGTSAWVSKQNEQHGYSSWVLGSGEPVFEGLARKGVQPE